MEKGANEKVVLRQFADTNARDFAAVMSTYSDDVTLVLHDELAAPEDRKLVRGKRAVGEWFGDWFSQFAPDYRFEIEESRESGDRVFLIATHLGQGRASGAPVEQTSSYIYTVLEGKVSRVELWLSRLGDPEA